MTQHTRARFITISCFLLFLLISVSESPLAARTLLKINALSAFFPIFHILLVHYQLHYISVTSQINHIVTLFMESLSA